MRKRRGAGGLFTGTVAAGMIAALIGMVDVWGNQAATGIVLAMLSLPHVNPPPREDSEKRVPTSPVAFFLQNEWQEKLPHDIDTWVRCETKAPDGTGRTTIVTVGYLQVQDVWLRLSKDDRGQPTTKNVEKVESTSDTLKVPPDTTCWVNAHLFNTHGGNLPIAARLLAVHQKDDPMLQEEIADILFTLSSYGQEITLLIVSWDKEGKLKKSSIRTYPDAETRLIMTGPQGMDGGMQ